MLTVNQLCWQPQNNPILTDINFAMAQGEILGVIGPNGAGKTSLLRCIYQSIEDYQGTITFNGCSLTASSKKQLAQQIAVVSQFNEPVFDLKVIDVVRMGLIPHKGLFASDNSNDQQLIAQALTTTNLTEFAQRSFDTLSGGEQQRALIARAIVQQPKLLILDEPTNHLDVYYQHQILSLVTSLGVPVLMTIHDLNLAAQYCQRLALLANGKLVAIDTPEKLLTPELLSQTFKLNCRVSQNHTQKPQVAFTPSFQQEGSRHVD